MIYNSDDIQKIIPHRYPFLLVDRIESIEGNKVVGIKCISANEMQFLGHFPQKAIMPGVLQLEALAQTVAVMLLSKQRENRIVCRYQQGALQASGDSRGCVEAGGRGYQRTYGYRLRECRCQRGW